MSSKNFRGIPYLSAICAMSTGSLGGAVAKYASAFSAYLVFIVITMETYNAAPSDAQRARAFARRAAVGARRIGGEPSVRRRGAASAHGALARSMAQPRRWPTE